MTNWIEIDVVRHAESTRNFATDQAVKGDDALHHELLRTGGEDWPLTDKGLADAVTLGELLRSQDTYAIGYTSPLVRAVETAELLGLACEWQSDERLRERRWGDFTGEEFKNLTTKEYLDFFKVSSQFNWRSPAPGSESIHDRYLASRDFIEEIIPLNLGKRIVLSTHGGAMKGLQMALEKCSPEEYDQLPKRPSANCAVHQYRLTDIHGSPLTWNVQFRSFNSAATTEEWQNV